MEQLHLEDGSRALVILAHPDDETIWLGGTIKKHPQVKWTIFSVCRASDQDRAPKFQKVCQYYGAEAIITDLDDDEKLTPEQALIEAKQLIEHHLPTKQFDYLFTHGANGEYGHLRHLTIHQAVTELINNQQLICHVGFYLHYKKDNEEDYSTLSPADNPDYLLQLSNEELIAKRKVVAEMYGYASDSIDVNYCTNPESFKIIKQ